MILRQVERVERARCLDGLMIATSTDVSDDVLASLCEKNGVVCFRGSLNDVLDRFYRAAEGVHPDHVVRLTGDCPLIDPDVIDRVMELHVREDNEYTSNTIAPTYPDGLDVEVLRFSVLEEAWRYAELPSEREHVTSFVHTRPERFRCGSLLRDGEDLSSMRWTVDEPEDYAFVKAVYDSLYPANPTFSTDDVLELLRKRPDLESLNDGFERNEGYTRSLLEDQAFVHRQNHKGGERA
ncbi:MAG: spore coat protein [Dethiosulfovibrio peptidovorans]|nr:MAG: spore coat protein [Dethiosulfovibrio peptidovorans]